MAKYLNTGCTSIYFNSLVMLISIIPTKIHGVVDYVGGAALVALPWILGISQYSSTTWIFSILGIISIIYSLFTRYESGYVGLISMRTHLWLDILVGLLLIASPLNITGFDWRMYNVHLIPGIIIIVLAFCTSKKPAGTHGPKLYPDKAIR